MRERNDGMLLLVPLFCFMSVLPLEKDMFVSFVSPVFLFSCTHRTVYTSARSCLSARTIHMWTHVWLKIPSLRRFHKNKITAMSSMFAFAHERSTLTSSSSIPSSRTTSQVTLPINKHCAAPPKEESGPLAKITSSTDARSWKRPSESKELSVRLLSGLSTKQPEIKEAVEM